MNESRLLVPTEPCCGRAVKYRRREWPTWPLSWMEAWVCRCGHILPAPVDGSEHWATLDATQEAGMAFDATLIDVQPEGLSPRMAAYWWRCYLEQLE